MAKQLKVEFPRNRSEWGKALIVGTVILVIGATPTLFDAYDAWVNHPHIHPYIMVWYVFVILVALTAWRVLYND